MFCQKLGIACKAYRRDDEPQALQMVFPCGSRRHRGVVVVPQDEQTLVDFSRFPEPEAAAAAGEAASSCALISSASGGTVVSGRRPSSRGEVDVREVASVLRPL